MSNDISAIGLRVRVLASNTFPVGFNVTEFADDADPLDLPSLQIGDDATGLNGDLVFWSTANGIPAILAVTPNGTDDKNLQLLAEANRAGRGKTSAKDKITLIISYPSGRKTTLIGGYIRDYTPSNGVASSGRLKSGVYGFKFENQATINA